MASALFARRTDARRCLAVAICCAAIPATASAGSIVLGNSGWQASWDASLDGVVDIAVDLVTPNAVFIEKSAEFLDGPTAGGFPTIPIVFRQIAFPAVGQIVLNDEIIANSTGSPWSGFRFDVIDSGDAFFNPDLSAGFNTSPFGTQAYTNDDTTLTVSGGTVPHGGLWFPGSGAGELYIDVNPHTQAPFTLFTLKETPLPEPSTMILLVAGALVCARRRATV